MPSPCITTEWWGGGKELRIHCMHSHKLAALAQSHLLCSRISQSQHPFPQRWWSDKIWGSDRPTCPLLQRFKLVPPVALLKTDRPQAQVLLINISTETLHTTTG